VVAGGDVEEELHDAAGDDGGEGGADQPAELVLGGEDYERSAEDEDHGNGEKRDGEEDGVEGEDADEEGGETGQGGHVLDLVAPKVEVHVDGVLDGANGPAGTLLQMGGEIFRNSAELQRLVNIGGSPSLSNKQVRSSDIFGDTTDGNSSYVVKSSAATDVPRTSTPSSVESILDGLSHVDEEIQRLTDGIRAWRIVKQLRRASHGDFAVGEQVRKTCAQPVRLGNLQEVSHTISRLRLHGKSKEN